MNIPITLNTKTFSPAMLAKPGQRSVFHLMVSAIIGQPEGGTRLPTDLVYVIDRSGSTGGAIPGTGDVILDKIQEAGQTALEKLEAGDRVGIISFDTQVELNLPLTACDGSGKLQAGNALAGIFARGGTNFEIGLQKALEVFQDDKQTGRNRVVLFLTDGEGGDASAICAQLAAEAKVTLYIAGLGVAETNAQTLIKMVTAAGAPDTNYKGIKTSKEVLDFFADVQAAASGTLIKSAKLRLAPPNFVTVNNFELVTRCKQPNFIPADPGNASVNIGDIGAADELDFYVNMALVLPDNIAEGRRSFGKMELVGEAMGSGKEEVLRVGNVVVPFVKVLPAGVAPDPEVREMMGLAAQAREMLAAANTTGATAAQHIAAAQEAARKTVAFNRHGAAAKLAESIKAAQAAAASGNPDAVKEEARRATRGFSAADRAKALANLGKK